jgi:acylphosphatase
MELSFTDIENLSLKQRQHQLDPQTCRQLKESFVPNNFMSCLFFRPAIFALTLVAWANLASAHAVWIESIQSAGRIAVHAGFGEANHWDQKNARKIDQTRYWLRTAAGEESPLELVYHARAKFYTTEIEHVGPAAIIASCDYGVSTHGGASLVKFTAKRYVGPVMAWAELDGATPLKAFELLARQEEKLLVVTALSEGNPVPNASVMLIGPQSDHAKYTTDANGMVRIEMEGPGAYSILASRTINEAGERDGAKFDKKRDITTLSFEIPGSANSASASLVADPAAAKELQMALRGQSLWGQQFPGFSADVAVEHQGMKANGQVNVAADGTVEVTFKEPNPEATRIVKDWLESMAWHRQQRNVGQAQSQATTETRPIPSVAYGSLPDSFNARGQELVPIGDPFASRFWIRNGALAAASRRMGERLQTITILGAEARSDGRMIPTSTATAFWDLNGHMVESETEERRWVEVNGLTLPAEVTSVTTEVRRNSSRPEMAQNHWRLLRMTFSNHACLKTDGTASVVPAAESTLATSETSDR